MWPPLCPHPLVTATCAAPYCGPLPSSVCDFFQSVSFLSFLIPDFHPSLPESRLCIATITRCPSVCRPYPCALLACTAVAQACRSSRSSGHNLATCPALEPPAAAMSMPCFGCATTAAARFRHRLHLCACRKRRSKLLCRRSHTAPHLLFRMPASPCRHVMTPAGTRCRAQLWAWQ